MGDEFLAFPGAKLPFGDADCSAGLLPGERTLSGTGHHAGILARIVEGSAHEEKA